MEPRRGQLLRGRLVLALGLPLPPRHDQEDEDADGSDEDHAADDRCDDEGDITGLSRGLFMIYKNITFDLHVYNLA